MKKRFQHRLAFLFSLLIMIIFLFAQWLRAGHSFFEDRLIVWFFDVGQGDSAFIESPRGYQILIDGGPDNSVLDNLSEVMPFWDRTIDAIILTHPHADHLSGLVDVLQNYNVKTVYLTDVDYYTPDSAAFEDAVQWAEQKVEVTHSFTIDLGQGVSFTIIYPKTSIVGQAFKDLNDSSIVGLLTYGETSVLLTGDAPAEIEPIIAEAVVGPVDVLKVGHHGSAYSSSESFLQDIDSRYAVISVGEGNSYGHPSLLTIKRLAEIGSKIFRTDLNGSVRCWSDATVVSCQVP